MTINYSLIKIHQFDISNNELNWPRIEHSHLLLGVSKISLQIDVGRLENIFSSCFFCRLPSTSLLSSPPSPVSLTPRHSFAAPHAAYAIGSFFRTRTTNKHKKYINSFPWVCCWIGYCDWHAVKSHAKLIFVLAYKFSPVACKWLSSENKST